MQTKVTKETVERIKTELRDVLDENPVFSIIAIARKLGVTRQTLWFARKKSKKIDRMISDYQEQKKPAIEDLVKNTWFNRLATGKAHGSEYLFFMMNHFPDEYQDRRAVVNNNVNVINQAHNHILIEQKFLQSLPEKDLDDIINGFTTRRKTQTAKSRV